MRPGALRLIGGVLLLVASTGSIAAPRDPRSIPPDEDRFLNIPLPDIPLTTAAGTATRLSAVGRGRPLLFTFVFTRCAGVCSPFLTSWRATASSRSFHRLVLSFDSRDSIDDMAALAHHLGLETNEEWTFAIAAPDDVRRLADATGFWYDWDEPRQQFDHPAMIAAARDGRLVRLLVGGTVSARRLDDLLREADGEFVASYPLPGHVLFRCVQFDARTGAVTLDWGFLLLLVPAFACAAATSAMFAAGRPHRR
jgi:cytochrome oxidase Cu insertion factor (SCO1/SenC/PrrC family)